MTPVQSNHSKTTLLEGWTAIQGGLHTMFATAVTDSHPLPPVSAPCPQPPGEPDTTFLLEAASLQPRLHNHDWTAKVRLSDDGFCDSTAHINLSYTLTMGLTSGGRTLSHRAVAELGLSTRQAWDLAADNLVVAARSPQGTRFYLRDAHQITQIRNADRSAVQVKVPGAPITAWLAHPRTFTILNNHLEELLGPNLIYLAPLSDLLLVLPASSKKRTQLEAWATTAFAGETPWELSGKGCVGGEQILSSPLIYRLGFPSMVSSPPPAGQKQAA